MNADRGNTEPRGVSDAEERRLADAESGRAAWRRWGPYVAERAWGSVREDYSADGNAWASFPFDQAVSRAYRWNEDGLSAWCDDQQRVCVGIALWNGYDDVLKERYFGLSGPQGNHGEDAKDYWWYVDGTPTHSYQCTRYAYPLAAFPYADLVATNAARDRTVGEYELIDTGIFAGDDYAMVTTEWAKDGPEDICLRVDVHNRSNHEAVVHVLPTVWFRNTWSWSDPPPVKPRLWAEGSRLRGEHATLGSFVVASSAELADSADPARSVPAGSVDAESELLFCDNETDVAKLYDSQSWGDHPAARYPKDGINDHVLHGADSVNPDQTGTKAAFHHILTIPAGEHRYVRLRLTLGNDGHPVAGEPGTDVDSVIQRRKQEADAFWGTVFRSLEPERAHVARQALAGLLASKQYYSYDVHRWAAGDSAQPAPPAGHAESRNEGWSHLDAADIILMPDAWEYPWFAAWDLSYHCMALALVDPQLAKRQLLLLLGGRYMHPNGDIPAYEWNFSDTNPPVQAWAALQIFAIDGSTDIDFLRRVMHKLLMNFTWWVNREDTEGNNIFEGGFLGLDNIGAFDRSKSMPGDAVYEQSDATAWMAMYCLDMLRIALTLARVDHTFDDLAVKFLLHFCSIAAAAEDLGLWDADDSFFYDQLRIPGDGRTPVKIRSVVGLIPLAAVTTLGADLADAMPNVQAELDFVFARRPDLRFAVYQDVTDGPMLLAMVSPERVTGVLRAAFDSAEFLSDFGLRSLSAKHRAEPAVISVGGQSATVDYEPAESRSGLFGGNSNWRGPIWFPVNVLLISALRRYHEGTAITVEYPSGSGTMCDLGSIAHDLSERLLSLFTPGPDGVRPCQPGLPWQQDVLFNEYFNGDTGAGLGASHQTGWTALIALLMFDLPG
ncbi:MAG: glucosidase [Nakamurella sp.]